ETAVHARRPACAGPVPTHCTRNRPSQPATKASENGERRRERLVSSLVPSSTTSSSDQQLALGASESRGQRRRAHLSAVAPARESQPAARWQLRPVSPTCFAGRTMDTKTIEATRTQAAAEKPLTDDEVKAINAWWRACNYLSVGMIYLR